ncbi:hypothetical protein ACC713_33980 [Rhizobium johnstonii]|uniref:hypothetical protein n=1 Tax=Rhizobium johnstonii TaxID=3019933 RepID=UPI003F9CB750
MPDLIALLVGATIVLFFSYERFNRTTDEAGQKLQRLVSLLTPDKLRSRRVVLNAYAFYATTFLLIYLILCAYAELIPTLGGPDLGVGARTLPPLKADVQEAVTEASPLASGRGIVDTIFSQGVSSARADPSFDINLNPSVSFGVALMIVGLAPAFPILQRFEGWMRGAAHRLAGIPTRVLTIRDELRSEKLNVSLAADDQIPADALVIPRGDWMRLVHYRNATKGVVEIGEDFHQDLMLIFAMSAWILDHRLKLENTHERERFLQLEDELKLRKEALASALDEKTDFGLKIRQAADNGKNPVTDNEPTKTRTLSWDRLANLSDELADDICILLAVYTEHEIIVAVHANASSDPTQTSSAEQRRLAREKIEEFLRDHLSDEGGPARSRSYTVIAGLWAFSVVALVTVAWSIFPGSIEFHLQNGGTSTAAWRMVTYVATAFSAFCIPIATALAIRDGSRQLRRWRNLWSADWTVFLPQAALVALIAWMLATLFILGTALWYAGVAFGWDENASSPWITLKLSFLFNAATPVRGAVLGLIIILLLDRWRAGKWSSKSPPRHRTNLAWACGSAVLMAVVGGLTRLASSRAGALQAAIPRESLDDVDVGLIFYAALYSAIVGFLVVLCVSEVLRNQRSRKKPINN